MLKFLVVALAIYGTMHLYALGKVWMTFPHSWAPGLALAGIVLTLSPLLVWFLERQGWHRATVATAWVSYTWMGYLFLFVCIGLVFDLGHALATLLHLDWPLNPVPAFRTVGLLAFALLGYGFIEARQIRVEEVNITTPKLASGRVTLALISDLHLGIMLGDGFLDRVIARLREIDPDIIVATGDIVDGQGDKLAALARHFQSCAAPLGAYAVTGNHEYYAGLEKSLRFLRDAGFTVLRGESVEAGGIVLVGVDDRSAATSGRHAGRDTRQALAAVAATDFVVLLKHQPVVDRDTPFDLQLSGHIHGGQIFPFGYLTQLAYGVRIGLTELADGRWLYVSRGTGTWGPPIRLFAPPEITLITIASTHK
ncbi:MAG: metallophosphoesterase [Gammaproteobacteria bacterium]|nr:metallophosphoesterase [Gammaproteobacteria bacterium]